MNRFKNVQTWKAEAEVETEAELEHFVPMFMSFGGRYESPDASGPILEP